jgi:glycosyltransferase involved in cell wall biosynthesis
MENWAYAMFNILHTEWSNGWGGQEIRIFLDASVLTEMGHRVTLLTVPQSGLAERAKAAGLRVIEMPMRNAFDPLALSQMIRLFRREKFDVVNTHSSVDSWLGSMAAKITGTPLLVRTRHLSVPLNTHALNFVYKWPHGMVTTAEMIRQRMIQVNGMDGERIVSIPTGVDLKRFDPNLDAGKVKESLKIPPDAKVVTMVAVLRSWKRHDVFLEAAARISQSHDKVYFLVVGEGPQRNGVKTHIDRLNLADRAIMTGYRDDVEKLLAISDVCVLTSESSEGVPQSVLQYQAMARPVVASNAGGIPEIVLDGKSGLVCQVNDPDDVAEKITRLLNDPALASTLGQNARKRVEERHSLKAMAKQTLAFYKRLFHMKAV